MIEDRKACLYRIMRRQSTLLKGRRTTQMVDRARLEMVDHIFRPRKEPRGDDRGLVSTTAPRLFTGGERIHERTLLETLLTSLSFEA